MKLETNYPEIKPSKQAKLAIKQEQKRTKRN